MFVFLHECDACESTEERVFTDNWTGKDLCLDCLTEVVGEVNMSPSYDGDNLLSLLIERGIIENDKEKLAYVGWVY
jgi:hypothetical protein